MGYRGRLQRFGIVAAGDDDHYGSLGPDSAANLYAGNTDFGIPGNIRSPDISTITPLWLELILSIIHGELTDEARLGGESGGHMPGSLQHSLTDAGEMLTNSFL